MRLITRKMNGLEDRNHPARLRNGLAALNFLLAQEEAAVVIY